MKTAYLLLSAAAVCFASPALAAGANDTATATTDQPSPSDAADDKPAPRQAFNTGVARARDALDTAISTSTITDGEITKIAPRSLADLARLIPGIRAEAGNGERGNSYTVRGLPLVSDGSKYIQLQENGLPVLEFGDFLALGPDSFMRIDSNLAGVQAIRGGSASTFASNAPGGIINLIDKTGDVEGGSIMGTTGLDYQSYRVDMDYGAHLSDTIRFHIGGFYRSGEGPRKTGYNAYHGGQVKLNVTKDFTGGYIRFYAKLLDDTVPLYATVPVLVSGSNDSPKLSDPAGFSVNSDTLLSRNITSLPFLDVDNKLVRSDLHDGAHFKSTTLGFEGKFDVGGWTINNRFRYSDNSGRVMALTVLAQMPAAYVAATFGGNGIRYVNGPNAGKTVVGGNGLLSANLATRIDADDLSDVTNDLRASRVWDVEGGKLTVTGGFYHADQTMHFSWLQDTYIQDVVGGGNSALVDITRNGTPITYGGVLMLGVPNGYGFKRIYSTDYAVNAPYGSFNFQKGPLAVGASVRYDYGAVRGSIQRDSAATAGLVDLNGDGVPDHYAAFTPTTPALPVHYDYHYWSYSISANYRMAENYSLFLRYSRGARAGADRILFSTAISPVDGSLVSKSAAYDPVRQLEGGFKFRTPSVTAYLTGFLANVDETNTQINTSSSGSTQLELVSRSYRAYGAEFEGSWRHGPFSVNAGATWTHAEITKDAAHPDYVGHTPRHQAALVYQFVPQFESGPFTVGASIVGTTKSYAQDVNKLRLPAYTTVGTFVQFRPVEQVTLSLNVSNLFDVNAYTDIQDGQIPAYGVVSGRVLTGRAVSMSLRFGF